MVRTEESITSRLLGTGFRATATVGQLPRIPFIRLYPVRLEIISGCAVIRYRPVPARVVLAISLGASVYAESKRNG